MSSIGGWVGVLRCWSHPILTNRKEKEKAGEREEKNDENKNLSGPNTVVLVL
jgi:hypothetical protein